jgi:hypothetical protein
MPAQRPKRKRAKWAAGLVVAVPLADGSWGVGQTAELMWPNVGYCAFFSIRILQIETLVPSFARTDLVALLAVDRFGVTSGEWPVLAMGSSLFPKAAFGNERFVSGGYVGAVTYDHELAASLLSAYHGLTPWNTWHDEHYLDGMLAPGVSRPPTARVLSTPERAQYLSLDGHDRGAV